MATEWDRRARTPGGFHIYRDYLASFPPQGHDRPTCLPALLPTYQLLPFQQHHEEYLSSFLFANEKCGARAALEMEVV